VLTDYNGGEDNVQPSYVNVKGKHAFISIPPPPFYQLDMLLGTLFGHAYISHITHLLTRL